MTGFFEVRKQCICFSGHEDVSCNRAHYRNNQKQHKIPGRDQYNNLADILQHQKPIMIQHCDIIHLMCIYKCFFINQQI